MILRALAATWLVGAIVTWMLLGTLISAEPLDGAPPMRGAMRVSAAIWWPVFWYRNITN